MVNDYFKGIKSLFNHTCNIYNFVESFDAETKQTSHRKQCILENEPCRISFKTIAASSDDKISSSSQQIKLFISNEIDINAGSIIEVFIYGKLVEYKLSGMPAIYSSHQEIILERSDYN